MSMTQSYSPLFACLVAWGALGILAGCGANEPGLVPVRGQITLDGGTWPREGVLYFTPVSTPSPDSPMRPASAKFGTDGRFAVTSFREGDGLFPGEYQVAVECWETEPGIAGDGTMIPGSGPVPESYRVGSTSGLTLTVEPQGATATDFDVKTP